MVLGYDAGKGKLITTRDSPEAKGEGITSQQKGKAKENGGQRAGNQISVSSYRFFKGSLGHTTQTQNSTSPTKMKQKKVYLF